MGKANEQAKDKPSLLNRWLNGIEKSEINFRIRFLFLQF